MKDRVVVACVAIATGALGGCVAMPADRGAGTVDRLVDERSSIAVPVPRWQSPPGDALSSRLLSEPIGASEAVQLALIGSPRMRELYARLGVSQAEVHDATRLANPSLGFMKLVPGAGQGAKTTWSIAQGFTDALFAGYRNRVGRLQALQAEQEVAQSVLALEAEVREAFFTHAGLQVSARMRAAAARGARVSADLAARFHDAGNISLLQRSREEAVASEASISVRRLESEALAARGRLLTLMGIALGDPRPQFIVELSLPSRVVDAQELQSLAMTQRLDLEALRTEIRMREQQAAHARRWRWLGNVALAGERERELDGDLLRGGGAQVELPVFNTGKGSLLRATALAESATARLAGLEISIRNDIAAGAAALEAARLSVDEYRTRLLPLRERIVDTSQREQNFMLIGAFELLAARREELDTYERYVDAVRDYWVQYARLASAAGGKLPGDEAPDERLVLPDLPAGPGAAILSPGGAQ